MATLFGRVQGIRHNSKSFFIFSLEVKRSENPKVLDRVAMVKGHLIGLSGLRSGVSLELHGKWVTHPKYGRQFSLSGWRPWIYSESDATAFLSDCVAGFSSYSFVRDLISRYGKDVLKVLGDEPDRILTDFGSQYPRDLLEEAVLAWDRVRSSYELATLLHEYDIPPSVLEEILAKFGSEAGSIIEENPYRLLTVPGLGFAQVDSVALKMGMDPEDPRRYEGAVLWVAYEATRQGHLYVRRQFISQVLGDLIRDSDETILKFVSAGIDQRLQNAIDRLGEAKYLRVDPEVGIYLPSYYKYERESAKKLAEFMTPVSLDIDLELFLSTYEKQNQISLSQAQREAVEKLLSNRVLALTGLPGTGKTTVIKTFVSLFRQAGLNFLLMAPTGIAAKRLEAVTGSPAGTVHRTLGYDGVTWGHDGSNRLSVDAIILDEVSMVDQELCYRVLEALNPNTMIVFVGDDAQLPSVGPGGVLRELISCKSIPTVRLTEIFRQSRTSDIVLNSHRINRGEAVQISDSPDSEFRFISMSDEQAIVNLIVKMASKLKSRDENFQVLSPKYEGIVGVNNLNSALREELNPSNGQSEFKAGTLHVRDGDRVMVIQNDYKKGVYNGDTGKVVGITNTYLAIRVHGAGIDGTDSIVRFEKDEAVAKLRLAYAITVHKSQGSEFGTVILPVTSGQGRMLQRNLFYTGVTRAKKKVWVLGEPSAINKAISNNKAVARNTVFGKAIELAAGVRNESNES